MKIKRCPHNLGVAGRLFWRNVLGEFEIFDYHQLRLLEGACQCWDRIIEARATIKKEGMYFTDRFGQPKEHPAHATERNNKILMSRLLREINLDVELPQSRPPGRY